MQKRFSFITFSVKVVWKRWWFRTIHPIFRSFSVLFRELYIVLFLVFIMPAVGSLKGWTFYELILCQSFISMSYAILIVFFSGLRDFRLIGKRRRLDIAFLRPKGILLQILLEDLDWFAAAGHGVLGIGLLILGVSRCHVAFTAEKALFLVCNLLGAVLIQASLWLFMAALECYITNTVHIKKILFWIPRDFLRLPLMLYPAALGKFFVYIAPFGFVSYFPVLGLLEKSDPAYPAWFCRFSMPLGIGMYLAAYGCWRVGLKRYRKTGGT